MKGNIIAANRNLGILVVKTAESGCVVLSSRSTFSLNVGDEVEGEWARPGETVVLNLNTGEQLNVDVKQTGVPQGEAIGSLSMF